MLFTVSEGTFNKNSVWQLTNAKTIVLNTTTLTFVRKDIPAYEAIQVIERAYCILSGEAAAGTYRLGPNPLSNVLANAAETAPDGTVIPNFIHLRPIFWEIAGKSAKVAVRFTILTNGTAPAITFGLGLYLMKQPKGEANKLKIEYEAAAAVGEQNVASPAKETHSSSGATFQAMPVEGTYSLLIKTSGKLPANCVVAIAAELIAIQE
jgi:hypothetical protein